eukprot:359416-Chlamydomonas_euryale.AAC.6
MAMAVRASLGAFEQPRPEFASLLPTPQIPDRPNETCPTLEAAMSARGTHGRTAAWPGARCCVACMLRLRGVATANETKRAVITSLEGWTRQGE